MGQGGLDRGVDCLGFLAGGFGEVITIAGVDDAAGGVEDHSPALAVAGGCGGSFEVSALGTDAGHEEEHVVTDDLPGSIQFFWVGGTDDEGAVAVLVPLLGDATPDMQPERRGRVADEQVLELAAAGVAGLGEEDEALVLVLQERRHGFPAEVGMEGDGVDLQLFESQCDVAAVGVADVAAFGVEDDGDLWKLPSEVGTDLFERLDSIRTVGLEEGDVGLVGGDILAGSVDDVDAKAHEHPPEGVPRPKDGRHLVADRIEADAEEPPFVHAVVEEIKEVSVVHVLTVVVLLFEAG